MSEHHEAIIVRDQDSDVIAVYLDGELHGEYGSIPAHVVARLSGSYPGLRWKERRVLSLARVGELTGMALFPRTLAEAYRLDVWRD